MSVYQKDVTILNVYSPNNRATENEAKTGGAEIRNGQIYKYTWILQHF